MREILEKLKLMHELKSATVKELLVKGISSEDFLEGDFLIGVNPRELDGLFCGVDGSILSQEFMTADIMVYMACASLIEYAHGTKKSFFTYPAYFQQPKFLVREGLEVNEVSWLRSICRLTAEYSLAREIVENYDLRLLLIDGSIIPLAVDRPPDDSSVYENYRLMLKEVVSFFKTARKKGVLVCGLAKDTRGKRIIDTLRRSYGNNVDVFGNDVSILNEIMTAKSRTSVMYYESSSKRSDARQKRNVILKDLEAAGLAEEIYVYYQRVSKKDKPIRVETINRHVEELAGYLQSLCEINDKYTYPAILIDADLRAKLEPEDLERISRLLSIEFLQFTRRTNRPFR